MTREPKLERLDIPASCREVKAWYPTRPDATVVKEILQHIQETGQPHTWRGHTHTHPPVGAVPVYLDEFDLPERLIKAKRFAPCPCCWPEHAKYGEQGKIAWFPAENVIRMLGPNCFRSLNPEAHKEAEHNLYLEKEGNRRTEFLLSNLPKLSDVVTSIENCASVAKALGKLHEEFHHKFRVSNINLWPYVRRSGELRVSETQKEFRRNSDGSMRVEEVHIERIYATLPGFEFYNPEPVKYAAELDNITRRLRPYVMRNASEAVADWDDTKKRRVSELLSRNVSKARECLIKIDDLRRFAEPVSINTLRSWAEHPGGPVSRYFRHNGQGISFGRSAEQCLTVTIPPELKWPIDQIDFWTDLRPRVPA